MKTPEEKRESHKNSMKKYQKSEKSKITAKRYQKSEKGKLALKNAKSKYSKTPSGKVSDIKYKKSEKGKLVQKRYKSKYFKSENGKIAYYRCISKRNRELGFIPLNKIFPNSEGHHINDTFVIFIPKDLHKLYRHNHNKTETMVKINEEAFKFMNPDTYIYLIEDWTIKNYIS